MCWEVASLPKFLAVRTTAEPQLHLALRLSADSMMMWSKRLSTLLSMILASQQVLAMTKAGRLGWGVN